MGNTRIQDSATGNIMSLSPGFIPVGMKEHGGIMYIASVNKDGQGEIGTIPSPIIRDIYKDKTIIDINSPIPFTPSDPLPISHKFYPTDRFTLHLDLDASNSEFVGNIEAGSITNPEDVVISRHVISSIMRTSGSTSYTAYLKTITNPIISYSPNVQPLNTTYTKGIYSLKLYSCNDLGKNWLQADSALYEALPANNYWFQHDDTTNFPVDLHAASLDGSLKPYPTNLKSGYLSIALEPEKPGKFGMIPRFKSPYNVPYTYKHFEPSVDGGIQNLNYYSYIPGFYYTTNSGIYIDHFASEIIDEATGQPLTLYYPQLKGKIPVIARSTTYIGNFTNIKKWDTSSSHITRLPIDVGVFSKPFSASTSVILADMDEGYLQRLYQDPEDGQNYFLLTNLLNVYSYKNSTLKSESGNDYHSGLFCVDLGQDWNRWLRLEADYYDQYNNYQGTFIQRFNPYLNDVFGTNLSFEGTEQAEAQVMGDIKYIGGNQITISPDTSTMVANYAHPNGALWGVTKYTNTGGLLIKGGNNVWTTPDVTFYLQEQEWNGVFSTSVDLPSYQVTYHTDSAPNNIQILQNDNAKYLYQTLPSIKLTTNSTNAELGQAWIGIGKMNNKGEGFITGKASDLSDMVIAMNGSRCSNVYGKNYTKYYMGDLIYRGENQNYYEGASVIPPWGLGFQLTGYDEGDIAMRSIGTTNYVTAGIQTQTCNWTDPNVSNIDVLLNVTLNNIENCELGKPLDGSAKRNPLGGFDERRWAITSSDYSYGLRVSYGYFFIKEHYTLPKINARFDKVTINPSYKITPYFRLTGTSESGKCTYVNKLYFTDDVWYECNFELDNDGIPKSYLEEQDNSKLMSTTSSYHKHEAKTGTTKLIQVQLQNAGIYVLNMSDATKTVKTDCTLTIDVANSDSLGEFMLAKTSENKLNVGSGVAQYYYQPIVIVVTENAGLELTFAFSGDNFTYQNIGLYKLRDAVVSGGSDDQSGIASITKAYTFSEYQKMIYENAQKLGDKAEQYQYIQKYGIFFQQAYCYLEGLVSDQNIVNRIQIPGKNYEYYSLVAYQLPKPYIINYMFDDKFENTYSCMYAMEEKVLTNPNNSKFIFWPKEQNLLTNISNNISDSTEAMPEGIEGYLRYKNQ